MSSGLKKKTVGTKVDWEGVVRGGSRHVCCAHCFPPGRVGPCITKCGEKLVPSGPLEHYRTQSELPKELCSLCELAVEERMPCPLCGRICRWPL